ncbi:MAG: acetyl-CoA carboxylase biotin carboxyl carrier protein [Chitinophagaceae bacterium]|nr:acetyl-CoA carboxylase biotin carboxyl carrier protein [Chitinophagaceae bacterium]MCB9046405.1 acetyl-CoA carboxylase biotin carboxyl carrier protein [Chitinophagales bacterium]
MDLKQIQELIKAVNKSELSELSIKDGDFEITIKQEQKGEQQVVTVQAPQPVAQQLVAPAPQAVPAAEAPAATPAPAPAADNTITIKSPMIGTFYRSGKPGEPPFVSVGDSIAAGDHICIIEAMKLFNEIESEVNGKIVKVLVDDASPVEFDQPLFLVEPA